jgi:hypothetical protein
MLIGMWDEGSETLTVRRSNGQTYQYTGASILSGSHKVFGVETVWELFEQLAAAEGHC